MTNVKEFGGDLQKLWEVANCDLAAVSQVYTEVTKILQDMLDLNGDDTYGRAYPAWRAMEYEIHDALFHTGSSLNSVCNILNQAVAQYQYVDGDTGGELTEVGKLLEANLKNDSLFDPKTQVPLEDSAQPPKHD